MYTHTVKLSITAVNPFRTCCCCLLTLKLFNYMLTHPPYHRGLNWKSK